jgi:GNAT superfamily N-acetyltransferase
MPLNPLYLKSCVKRVLKPSIKILPACANDRAWIIKLLQRHWGSPLVVSRGRLHDASCLPGFIAARDSKPCGLLTYRIAKSQCEIVTLNSLNRKSGIGTALIDAVIREAKAEKCRRVWLITTNDNLPALGFYQKRGFRLAAVHVNALQRSRKLKPQIPATGLDGIPLRDEIELEMLLPRVKE